MSVGYLEDGFFFNSLSPFVGIYYGAQFRPFECDLDDQQCFGRWSWFENSRGEFVDCFLFEIVQVRTSLKMCVIHATPRPRKLSLLCLLLIVPSTPRYSGLSRVHSRCLATAFECFLGLRESLLGAYNSSFHLDGFVIDDSLLF